MGLKKTNTLWSEKMWQRQKSILITVDGRNPAPLGMYKTLWKRGINYLSTGAGFFHQQYLIQIPAAAWVFLKVYDVPKKQQMYFDPLWY